MEKGSNLQGEGQIKKGQRLVISSSETVADSVEIPETDTSSFKTMTGLQGARPGNDISEGVCQMNVDPVGSVQSSGESEVNAFCEEKFRSLSEGELQTLAKVDE